MIGESFVFPAKILSASTTGNAPRRCSIDEDCESNVCQMNVCQ